MRELSSKPPLRAIWGTGQVLRKFPITVTEEVGGHFKAVEQTESDG